MFIRPYLQSALCPKYTHLLVEIKETYICGLTSVLWPSALFNFIVTVGNDQTGMKMSFLINATLMANTVHGSHLLNDLYKMEKQWTNQSEWTGLTMGTLFLRTITS